MIYLMFSWKKSVQQYIYIIYTTYILIHTFPDFVWLKKNIIFNHERILHQFLLNVYETIIYKTLVWINIVLKKEKEKERKIDKLKLVYWLI